MIFREKHRTSIHELRVCPSLTDDQYLVAIRRLADNLARGCATSLLLDRGENFVQSRAWLQGDPSTSIDWKASARSRDLVVKEHESLRQTVVSLVIDRSGSMTTGSSEASKYAAACILCGGLAFAALKTGSPVAFLLSDATTVSAPLLSTSKVSASLAAMRCYPRRDPSPLSRCLKEGFGRDRRRQLVFVLSDFHDPCALEPITRIAKRHEVVLVRLRDSAEVRTPVCGTILLQPAEGGTARHTRAQRLGGVPTWSLIEALGLPTVMIDPAQPVSGQLGSFLNLRSRLP